MAIDVLSFVIGSKAAGGETPVPPIPTDFTILNTGGTMGIDNYVYGEFDTSIDFEVGDKYHISVLNNQDAVWFETDVYAEAGEDIYSGYDVLDFTKYLPTTDTSVVSGKTYYGLFAGVYTAIQSPTAAGLSTYFEKTKLVTVVKNGSFNYSTTPISISPSETASWRWGVGLSYRQTIVAHKVAKTERSTVKWGDTIEDDWETIMANADRYGTDFYNIGDTKTLEFNYLTSESSRPCGIPMAIQLEVTGKEHDILSKMEIVNRDGTLGEDYLTYGDVNLSSKLNVGDVYTGKVYSNGVKLFENTMTVYAGADVSEMFDGYNILYYDNGNFIIVDGGKISYSGGTTSILPSDTASWRWNIAAGDEFTLVLTKLTHNNKAALTFIGRWLNYSYRYNALTTSDTTPGTGNNGGWGAASGDIYKVSLDVDANDKLIYGCTLRKMLWDVYKSFPENLQKAIKIVDKDYDDNTSIQTVKDKIFIPSLGELGLLTYIYQSKEMYLSEYYFLTSDTTVESSKTYYKLEDNVYVIVTNPVDADLGSYYERKTQGAQYARFPDATSRKKSSSLANTSYLTRSRMRRPDNNAYVICINGTNGGAANGSATSFISVCFGFCL